MEQARSVDGEQGAFVDIDDIQRFSQLRTKSASDLDLTKDYQTLGASATPPVRSEGRKLSYAGVIPNTFMSESCDNVSDLGVSSKGSFNNYVDKMRGGGGQKMSVFVHAQGIKTVHAGGGGQKMAKFCPRSC